jgi:hypothetical protein
MWILVDVTSCRYCGSMEGLTEVREINKSMKIANSVSLKANEIGNLKCEVTQLNGEKLIVKSNNVK